MVVTRVDVSSAMTTVLTGSCWFCFAAYLCTAMLSGKSKISLAVMLLHSSVQLAQICEYNPPQRLTIVRSMERECPCFDAYNGRVHGRRNAAHRQTAFQSSGRAFLSNPEVDEPPCRLCVARVPCFFTVNHDCFPQYHLDDNPNIPSLPVPPPRVVKLRYGCPARGSTPEGDNV